MRNMRWLVGAAALLVGFSLGALKVTPAQNHYDDHHGDSDHHDNGHHNGHERFDDHDRQEAHEWYAHHHTYFHESEGRYWHNSWEGNIHEGFVFTPDMRHGYRPVPHDLMVRLGPVPHGYRYVVIGDHVVLVDDGWRIHDVLHFEANF
jgi:hypothetical protein